MKTKLRFFKRSYKVHYYARLFPDLTNQTSWWDIEIPTRAIPTINARSTMTVEGYQYYNRIHMIEGDKTRLSEPYNFGKLQTIKHP